MPIPQHRFCIFSLFLLWGKVLSTQYLRQPKMLVLPELWCQSAPQQGCLSVCMDAWNIPWGLCWPETSTKSRQSSKYSIFQSASLGLPLLYPKSCYFLEKLCSFLRSVQRMIRNSKELVLALTDSLKVWRIPGSLSSSCHLPRATTAGPGAAAAPSELKLPVQGLGTVTSSLHQTSGTDSFHLS